MRRRIAATLLTITAAAGFAVAPPADAAIARGVRYAALGDSYSAASGVLPPDPTAPPNCARSASNYPHVIAQKIGARLTDVTCGGAQTKHFFTAFYPNVGPQLDAVSGDTRLVTMTIGGNDSGVFANTLANCGSLGLLSLGMGSPCADKYGSSFQDTIRNTTYPSLVKALNAVKAKAPRATIAILGYPWIMPASDGCFPIMPVARGDVPYVRGIQATLNDAVRRAAGATSVTYVDMNKVSEGHDACQPIGVRWIEPAIGGTNPVIVHPNALGESKMAATTMSVLKLR